MRRYLSATLLLLFLLSHPSTAQAVEEDRSVIQAALAPLRQEPQTNSSVIRHLEIGRQVMVLRRHGDWAKVAVVASGGNAEIGWLQEAALSRPEPEHENRKSVDLRYKLKFTGTPQDYRARCTMLTSSGELKKSIFQGRVPGSIVFTSPEVSCLVDVKTQHTNGFTATLYEKGRRLPIARSVTDGFPSCVILRSKGYWGDAFAKECTEWYLTPDVKRIDVQ